MKKVILGVAVSLDGFIEGPNGEYDWCFTDQDYGMAAFLKRIDTIFMGRKTYEQSLTMGGQNPWKGKMTYVFSNSIKEIKAKDTRLISGDVKSKVVAIKKEKGKDIWMFGGAELTVALMSERLIDELWLSVHPVLLGTGKPLFSGLKKRIKTKLMYTKTYNSGLVSLKYEVENL